MGLRTRTGRGIGRVALVFAVLAGLGGLTGCGSAQAPAPDPDTASGRSLQKTCPLLGTVLRRGMVGSRALSRIADTADSLTRAGDRNTSEALSALPADARALAASPDSEADLDDFQHDVTSVQRACRAVGAPMSY